MSSRKGHCDLHWHQHRKAQASVTISGPTWINKLCTECTLTWLYGNYGDWVIVTLAPSRRRP